MSHGTNPCQLDARAAELLVDRARDDASRVEAHREAARAWERAADAESVAEDEVEAAFFAKPEPDPRDLN